MAGDTHADNHGNTVAAWALVVIVLIGFTVGAVGLVIDSASTFWIGVALCPFGALVGYVLKLMGFGAKITPHPEVSADQAPFVP